MKRSEAREQAFILSFERIFNMDTELTEMKTIASESELFELDAYAQTLAELVFDKAEELDSVISSFLKGWKIERLPRVVLAVLRLAVAEINSLKYSVTSFPMDGTKFWIKVACSCSLISTKTGNAEKIAKPIAIRGTNAIRDV